MRDATDTEIAELARQGDREAFTALYDRYVGRIHDFAFGMLRNREDAEDVTSQTFLKAVERIEGLREPAAFTGWLYGIARNAALDLIDKRKREGVMPEHTELMRPAFAEASPGPPSPEATVEGADLEGLVREATATLNPRDQTVFEMTVRHGLGSAEVAEALGVKTSHAYVLVNRLKDSVDTALGVVVLARAGRRDCDELDGVVAGYGEERSPKMRKAVTRHLKGCETCQGTRARYASLEALVQGVAHAEPRPEFIEALRGRIRSAPTGSQLGEGTGMDALDSARRGMVVSSVVGVLVLGAVFGIARPVGVEPTPPPSAPAVAEISVSPTPASSPEATSDAEPTSAPRRRPAQQGDPGSAPLPTATPLVVILTPGLDAGDDRTTDDVQTPSEQEPEPTPTRQPDPNPTPTQSPRPLTNVE